MLRDVQKLFANCEMISTGERDESAAIATAGGLNFSIK